MSTLRTPQIYAARLCGEAADAALQDEIAEEKAGTLGRMERRMVAALARLRDHQGEDRGEAVKAAADAVWSFLLQREILGLRDRAAVVAQYDVPREVMARLGAR